MVKKRLTQAEQVRERANAERRAWEEFIPKLSALNTYDEAKLLVGNAPPQNSPGRKYYSNLGFFLNAFNVPAGSNQTERSLYIQFIQKLDAAGELKPDAVSGVLEALRKSLSDHP